MTEYKVGDLVRCIDRSLGTVVEGVVSEAGDMGNWLVVGGIPATLWVDKWDWSLVEAAPIPLPTESGFYSDPFNNVWQLLTNSHGGPEWYWGGAFKPLEQVAKSAPFTRLEPVPETARKVLNAIDYRSRLIGTNDDPAYQIRREQLKAIRKEFGVTP